MFKPDGYSISTCPLVMGLTEAYSRPLLFMARYRPEKSPLMATTPTSTAVISRMPGKSQEGSVTCLSRTSACANIHQLRKLGQEDSHDQQQVMVEGLEVLVGRKHWTGGEEGDIQPLCQRHES